MDENAGGPPFSSPESSVQPSSSNGWSSASFLSVPPPPAPFGSQDGAAYSPADTDSFEVDVNVNAGEDDDDEEDLDALLFGSTSFQSVATGKDEEELDRLFFDRASFLSLTSDKNDEEISKAFQSDCKDETSSPPLLFRCITQQPGISLNSQSETGDGGAHVFTVTSPSSTSSNGTGIDPPKLESVHYPKSLERFKHTHPINLDRDDEDHTSGSFQNSLTANKTDEDILIPSSNSQSDSGGISEEDARISSEPMCSAAYQIPEHTLSDISGPCSSSLIEKVPASFKDANKEEGKSIGLTQFSTKLEGSMSLKQIKKCAIGADPEGSITTTSSSSFSESEGDYAEDHRVLCLLSRSDSIKDENGLLLPPPPLLHGERDEIVPMTVDTCEDYWTRLHDVRINGSILQYAGIGKSLHDNGFAQSNVPLTPLNHYFEITILDPGEFCYISIGLARKDYNVHRNPGWCRGSIAYHADDGKIFIGGGVGTPFGPKCSINDVLGCGIIFPCKYGSLPEGSSWPWEMKEEEIAEDKKKYDAKSRLPKRQKKKLRVCSTDNFGDMSSESEDDIWWNNKNQVCEDKVKVFFMRNRKLLGMKEVRIPKGGFYPTVGMMSTNERVSVDLHPLTG